MSNTMLWGCAILFGIIDAIIMVGVVAYTILDIFAHS